MQSSTILPIKDKPTDFKCVLVSSAKISQAHLMDQYFSDHDNEYQRTVYENTYIPGSFENHPYRIHVWPTDGQQDSDLIRPMSYSNTNLFILFFSYEDLHSFEEIETKWHPELKRYEPKVPIYLVGIHSATEKEKVSVEQASQLAKELQMTYLDCASSKHEIVRDVFNQIFTHHLFQHFFPGKQCKHPFFARNFNSIGEGLKFAKEVAVITQGHQEEGHNLRKLPVEIIYKIFDEVVNSVIKDPSNYQHYLNAQALYKLVYGNVSTRHHATQHTMMWHRQYVPPEQENPVSIYPEPEGKGNGKSKGKGKNSKNKGKNNKKGCMVM